jgi:hypothetical protein
MSYCREIEGINRQQSDRLVRVSEELDVLREKAGKHQNCQRTIQDLLEKVSIYEKKILKSAHARRLFGPDPHIPVFENKLIYQLKCENDSLRLQLPDRG